MSNVYNKLILERNFALSIGLKSKLNNNLSVQKGEKFYQKLTECRGGSGGFREFLAFTGSQCGRGVIMRLEVLGRS